MIEKLQEKATARISAGYEVARDLRYVAKRTNPENQEVIEALADRIHACNSRENAWIGEDLHDEESGELFASFGRLWSCGSRLCPDCLAKQSKRNRKKLRLAMQRQQLLVGEHFNFITLTIPNPNLPLLKTRELVNRAWTLFRKLKYFRTTISGGGKAEEFTFTRNGYHYHLHLVVRAKYLHYNMIRMLWTQCLAAAFLEAGIMFAVNTKDGNALCKVQRVGIRAQIENEVCKYMTKSDSWRKIPVDDFIAIASIRRFPRMFELFGCFKDLEEKTILDTEDISDGEATARATYWRHDVEKRGREAYLADLNERIAACMEARKQQLRRKYPFATFRTLSDYQNRKLAVF